MKKEERVGEKFTTKEGYEVEIIEYTNTYNCKVRFSTGNILSNVQYGAITRGEVKNPLHRSVNGVGYLGNTSLNGETVRLKKSYITWRGIIGRCYNNKLQEKHPTYIGCSVHPDWHNYQVFSDWFDYHYVEGWNLDKDIIKKDNKIYSFDTCCFVPREINILFRKEKPTVGIRKKGNKYEANATFLDKPYLGIFDTLELASNAYEKAKQRRIFELLEKYGDKLSEDCYNALLHYTKAY